MVRPTYFDIEESVNPLMDPRKSTSSARAVTEWERLRDLYTGLGHHVAEIEPLPGLPDMVFATNGATAIGDKVLVSRFRHAQRTPESDVYLGWFTARGYPDVRQAKWVNEGDNVFTGNRLLVGSSPWTTTRAHEEMRDFFDCPVVPLTLVDPRWHRLDTALAVLDADTVMYHPPAFSPESRALLEGLYPDAIPTSRADAAVYGLCAVSDGRHVVLPAAAGGLFGELVAHGFEPIGIDLSELAKAGGGVRTCTLELHAG
jgi:N-dimethylarginine dimethylaminohydrolase